MKRWFCWWASQLCLHYIIRVAWTWQLACKQVGIFYLMVVVSKCTFMMMALLFKEKMQYKKWNRLLFEWSLCAGSSRSMALIWPNVNERGEKSEKCLTIVLMWLCDSVFIAHLVRCPVFCIDFECRKWWSHTQDWRLALNSCPR